MASILLPPQEGKSVWLAGLGVDFKISGEQTGGAFSVVEHPIEPGRLVPPHLHGVTTFFRVNPTLRPLTGLMTNAFHSLKGKRCIQTGLFSTVLP